MNFLKPRWYITCGMILLVACFVVPLFWFGGLVASSPISHFLTAQSYQQGQCTIEKKDLRYFTGYDQNNGNDYTQYAPDLTFLVHATPEAMQAEGYATDAQMFDNQADAQAILDRYQIGQIYTCWYDASNASHAILTRDVPDTILLLPAGIMLLVGLMILVAPIVIGLKLRGRFRR